jgi:hypoxanthine phosphoribosyltransferase
MSDTPSEMKLGTTAEVLRTADLLCSPGEVDAAFDRMAREITGELADRNPLLLAVMLGGMIPAARLVCRLDFPVDLDYVHATRYQGDVRGRDLDWVAHPRESLAERTVLVVDDILDEGVTLAAIVAHCREAGASAVYSAVLVDKDHDRKAAGLQRADFTGLTVPDRYVFGCGMDYRGQFRHLRGIYAVRGL